jgi:hypothetical protein
MFPLDDSGHRTVQHHHVIAADGVHWRGGGAVCPERVLVLGSG